MQGAVQSSLTNKILRPRLLHLFCKECPITVGTEGKEITFYAHKDVAQTPCHCDIFKSLVNCVSGSCLQRYKKVENGEQKREFYCSKNTKNSDSTSELIKKMSFRK